MCNNKLDWCREFIITQSQSLNPLTIDKRPWLTTIDYKLNITIFRVETISILAGFYAASLFRSNLNFLECWFLWREKTGEPGWKPSEQSEIEYMAPSWNWTRVILVRGELSHHCAILALTNKIISLHSKIHRAFPLKEPKCVTNNTEVHSLLFRLSRCYKFSLLN